MIADNQLALNAGWNEKLLAAELTDLRELAFYLDPISFEDKDLSRLLGCGEAIHLEDEVPAVSEQLASRPGDLWLLGSHRLLCGDATDASAVSRLLGGVRPHLMVTDPPYGVEYDPAWRNEAGASKTQRTGKVLNEPVECMHRPMLSADRHGHLARSVPPPHQPGRTQALGVHR